MRWNIIMSQLKAVLRRGQFCSWLTLGESLLNEYIFIPIPLEPVIAAGDMSMTYQKSETWRFRFHQYLDDKVVEYVFDGVEHH